MRHRCLTDMSRHGSVPDCAKLSSGRCDLRLTRRALRAWIASAEDRPVADQLSMAGLLPELRQRITAAMRPDDCRKIDRKGIRLRKAGPRNSPEATSQTIQQIFFGVSASESF
jgi:hypothetical protein